MPKTSRKQIDSDEKKVIKELQKNANESIDKLAKKCGFSRQKVWRIIKRLEHNQTIWGYHAVVDDEKLNQKSFVMMIKRSNEPMENMVDKIIKNTIEEIGKKVGSIVHCNVYLHGVYDWMILFTAEDVRHAKKFSEVLNKEFGKLIDDITIMEMIFPLRRCQILNPQLPKFKDFF